MQYALKHHRFMSLHFEDISYLHVTTCNSSNYFNYYEMIHLEHKCDGEIQMIAAGCLWCSSTLG